MPEPAEDDSKDILAVAHVMATWFPELNHHNVVDCAAEAVMTLRYLHQGWKCVSVCHAPGLCAWSPLDFPKAGSE